MSDQILTFGRNLGATYEQVLTKDLPWCQFMDKCPANDKTKAFKDWLKVHLQRGIDLDREKKLEAFRKRFA